MKSFIKSTLGFKGKNKKNENELIPSKRNFKLDEISAATLIDLLDANVRKKSADKSKSGLQLSNSAVVGSLVESFMEGTLTKEIFLKLDASTLWSVVVKILETCNPILSFENCSNLRNATQLQVSTITDGLPLHHQQILGALFATAEILIQCDDSCSLSVTSSLSNALLWSLTPDSAETSESFVSLISNHRQNLPYCFTFSRRVGSAHDEIPSSVWTQILSSHSSSGNSGSTALAATSTADVVAPPVDSTPTSSSSKAGLYKALPVQKSLQLNVVDDDEHTPASAGKAAAVTKLSGEVDESRARKLSDSSVVLVNKSTGGSNPTKSTDSWASAGGGNSSSTSQEKSGARTSTAAAAALSAVDEEEGGSEKDQKEDDSIVSLRDLQEVFASSLVSAASLEYLNVRELKEDDYADVKALVRNVKWTLSHSELAAAVGEANKNVKESLKGILAWNDFLVLAGPYLHKTDKRFLSTHSIRYDQQYKRPDAAAAAAADKKGATAAAPVKTGGAKGYQSETDSSEEDASQRPTRSAGTSKQTSGSPSGDAKKTQQRRGYNNRDEDDNDDDEETLDEIVMSNSPVKGGGARAPAVGFKRDPSVGERNTAARAVLRSVVDQEDSDEDGQSIPDISEIQPTSRGGYGSSSNSNNRAVGAVTGRAVASKLASAHGAPLASSLVSDHSFDDESGDDIPTLEQDRDEDRRGKIVDQQQQQRSQELLNNSWDEDSMRYDDRASAVAHLGRVTEDSPLKPTSGGTRGGRGLDDSSHHSPEQDSNIMALLRDPPVNQQDDDDDDEFGDAQTAGRGSAVRSGVAATTTAGMTKRKQPQVSMFSLTELDRSTATLEEDAERDGETLHVDTAAAAAAPSVFESINLNSPGQLSENSAAAATPQEGGGVEGQSEPKKKKKGIMSKFKAALKFKSSKGSGGSDGSAVAGGEEAALGGRIRSMSTNSMNSVGTDEGSIDISTHNNATAAPAAGVQGSPSVAGGGKKSMFSVLGFGRRPSATPSSPAEAPSSGIAETSAAPGLPHQSSITMRQEAEENKSRSSTPTITDQPQAAQALSTSSVVGPGGSASAATGSLSAGIASASSGATDPAAVKPKSKWFTGGSSGEKKQPSVSSAAATTAQPSAGGTVNASSSVPAASSSSSPSSAAAAAAEAPSIAELASSYSQAVSAGSTSTGTVPGRLKRAHSSSEVLTSSSSAAGAAPVTSIVATSGGSTPSGLQHSMSVPTLDVNANPASSTSGTGPGSVTTAGPTNKLTNPAPKRTLSGIFSAPFRSKPTRSQSIDLGTPLASPADVTSSAENAGQPSTAAVPGSAEGSPVIKAAAAHRPSLLGSLLRRSSSNNSITGGPSSAQGTPTGGLRKTPSASHVSIRANGLGLASLLRGGGSGGSAGSPTHGDGAAHSPSKSTEHATSAGHKHKKKHMLTVVTEVTAVMKLQQALQKSKDLHEYIENNSGTAMYHHKKSTNQTAAASEALPGDKPKGNSLAFEVPTKPTKLDLLEEMKLIQRNAANHELRSFDASLFKADDGFRSHHHTMEPDEEYLEEVHRAWNLIAKRRAPLNMIVSAQDIELMKYLTKLFEKPAPPDAEAVAALKVEARLKSTTSVLYPRFGEFVHSPYPVVTRASLVPDEGLLKRQIMANSGQHHHHHHHHNSQHSELDLALGVKHGGPLLKSSGRRGAWRKRYFCVLVEPWVNPNLGGVTPILDAQNTTMPTPAALQDDGGRSIATATATTTAAPSAAGAATVTSEPSEAEAMCDYYLQEYERSVTSKWGSLPLRLKQSYNVGKMISIVTDSSASKKGREFTVTFKLNKRINRSGVSSAEEMEANRITSLDAADDDDDEGEEGRGSVSSGGGSVVSGADHSSSSEDEGDNDDQEVDDEVAVDLAEMRRRSGRGSGGRSSSSSKKSKSVRLSVDPKREGPESKTDGTVNQITELNNNNNGGNDPAAVGDGAANADVVLEHVDSKQQKKLKKKDRNIVSLRLKADTSDERLLWIKMLLAVGTTDVYVNTVSY